MLTRVLTTSFGTWGIGPGERGWTAPGPAACAGSRKAGYGATALDRSVAMRRASPASTAPIR
ncbi:hypothetical protein J2853_001707 [Streptosporangium lutulentum]|uniref:Uncharacterized protein n=1 Tax=Streptosporangium lutulentum TaxID=1461250 RepID=A0ABT9Q7X8_9ACTN|nr:hypothetical protein [Streptosporangium lutulentum]